MFILAIVHYNEEIICNWLTQKDLRIFAAYRIIFIGNFFISSDSICKLQLIKHLASTVLSVNGCISVLNNINSTKFCFHFG